MPDIIFTIRGRIIQKKTENPLDNEKRADFFVFVEELVLALDGAVDTRVVKPAIRCTS